MLVATNNPDSAKMAPYECGMPPASDARHKFQISFFLVAILFLVFDCEVLFLYPLVVSLYHISSFGFWIAMIFILLLTIGFIYELGMGALDYAKNKTNTSSSQNSPSGKVPNGLRFYSTSSENTSNNNRKRDKGNPKYTFQYRTSQTLTLFQAEVLVGLLLGDGCINTPISKIGGHRLTIRHSMDQHSYLLHLHELFEPFIVKPIYIGSNLDKRTGETYHWCNLHTLYFLCFASYRSLFYNNLGIKIVPSNLKDILTPVGLAYWIADDGHYHKSGGGVYLCTDSFSLVEVQFLINILKDKLILNVKLIKPLSSIEYIFNQTLTPSQSEALIGLLLGDYHISKKLSIKG